MPSDRNDAADQRQLVGEIAQLREPASIPALFGVLCGGASKASEAAAEAIEQVVGVCSPQDLAQLDHIIRDIGEWRASTVQPGQVRSLSGVKIGPLGIFSFHASGFVREAAIHSLDTSSIAQALPFLLIRLNDWVAAVRSAATDAIVRRIHPANAAAFVDCLPLIFRLKSQSRGGHQSLIEKIVSLLGDPECRPHLRIALQSPDRETRRLAFRLILDQGSEDLISVLKDELNANDLLLRLWAAQWIRKHLPDDQLEVTLKSMLLDRFMPVRREAIQGFVERLPILASACLHNALMDPHASIRDLARYLLRQSGETHFAQVYRQILLSPTDNLATAIAGLRETGVKADAGLVSTYLSHPNARVRRATVLALGGLDPGKHDSELFAAIDDESARVAKAAREMILTRRHLLTPSRVTSLFQTAQRSHVQLIALSLIGELEWWDSAPLLLAAAGSEDQNVQSAAFSQLRRWRRNCHRLSIKPTEEQLRRLENELRLKIDHLDKKTREDVQEHLRLGRDLIASQKR